MSLGDEWERHADTWVRFTPHDVFFERCNWPACLELLPEPGRATLDVGCGEGRIGALLREQGHRVTGVDVAPTMAQRPRERGVYEELREPRAPECDPVFAHVRDRPVFLHFRCVKS